MLDEEFSQGHSLLHRRDARVKLVVSFTFIALVATTQSFTTAVTSLIVAILLVFTARLPTAKVARRLLVVNSFTFFLWLILPLTYGGSTTVLLGVPLSVAGLKLALLISLKTNAIILSILALLSTSTIAAIGYSLQSLGVPNRLSFLILFSYRNINVIYTEYKKLLCAAKMRNFTPQTNMHTYKTYSHLFAMTLVKSWNRGERIQEAMTLRGFDGKFHTLEQSAMLAKDFIFLGISFVLIACIACLNFTTIFPW